MTMYEQLCKLVYVYSVLHSVVFTIKIDARSELFVDDLANHPDCKHSIEDRKGNITNVGYPEVDVTVQDCDWIINLQSGSHVKLQIVDIDLPLATLKGQCLVSKVMIGGYDYYGHRVILKELCGITLPHIREYHTKTRRAWVRFQITSTEKLPNFRGFMIRYEMEQDRISVNQKILAVLGGCIFPVACCVPIGYYYRRQKKQMTVQKRHDHYMVLQRNWKLMNQMAARAEVVFNSEIKSPTDDNTVTKEHLKIPGQSYNVHSSSTPYFSPDIAYPTSNHKKKASRLLVRPSLPSVSEIIEEETIKDDAESEKSSVSIPVAEPRSISSSKGTTSDDSDILSKQHVIFTDTRLQQYPLRASCPQLTSARDSLNTVPSMCCARFLTDLEVRSADRDPDSPWNGNFIASFRDIFTDSDFEDLRSIRTTFESKPPIHSSAEIFTNTPDTMGDSQNNHLATARRLSDRFEAVCLDDYQDTDHDHMTPKPVDHVILPTKERELYEVAVDDPYNILVYTRPSNSNSDVESCGKSIEEIEDVIMSNQQITRNESQAVATPVVVDVDNDVSDRSESENMDSINSKRHFTYVPQQRGVPYSFTL